MEKYHKLCDDIRSFLDGDSISKYSVKGLERIRGKVISFLIVNPGLKLYIREMTALLTLADRDGLEFFTEEMIMRSHVEQELNNWLYLHNSPAALSRKWYSDEIETIVIRQMKSLIISTDASTYQGGIHIEVGSQPGEVIEMSIPWSPEEAALDIACKEILIIKKTLQLWPGVCGKHLIFKVDNTVVVNSFKNDGCRNLMVTRIQKEILELATQRQCHVHLDWISTHLQAADAPSRNLLSHNDSRINFSLRYGLISMFPFGIDLFATFSNRVFHRYYSRYEEFCSEGIFVFEAKFSPQDTLYAYPPSSLQLPAITMLRRHSMNPQVMLLHEFGSNALVHLQASEHFQYRLLVGNRRNPCCITTGKQLHHDGYNGDYYRNYGEPFRSWLYFRNVSVRSIQHIHHLYCQQRHPLALLSTHKLFRRIFRLWRMVVHRDLCADFRHNRRSSHLVESCRDSSPFCLRIEKLECAQNADSA